MKRLRQILILTGLLFSPQILLSAEYHNHAQLSRQLLNWSRQHRRTISVHEQAKTRQGRAIWSVTLSKADRPEEQPALLIIAGIDGRDLASTELALGFLDDVLNKAQTVDSVARMLQQTTFYIFPRLHPDATETFFAPVQQECTSNTRPQDDDRDGRVDEDGCEDLNRDAMVAHMRVRDPEGEFILDEQDPFLLRRADRTKGEIGIYRVFQEGRDDDQDGSWNEDGPGGVTPNRNFSFAWNGTAADQGEYPFSDAETRTLADFCFSHPNITAVLSYSDQDNLLQSWPASAPGWQWPAEREVKPINEMPPQDAAVLRHLADVYKTITGRDQAPENPPARGDLAQWAYYHLGRWSLTTRAWWPTLVQVATDSAKKQVKDAGKDSLATQRRLLHWLQKYRPDGIIPWQPFNHPDFPDRQVEIGGFRPFVFMNPPADSLALQVKTMNAFIWRMASLLPRTVIQQFSAIELHRGVYRLEAVLVNQGYLPTATILGSRMNICRKLKTELSSADEFLFMSGQKVQILETLAGSGGAKRLSWVVKGKPNQRFTLKAGSPMSGISEQVVQLP